MMGLFTIRHFHARRRCGGLDRVTLAVGHDMGMAAHDLCTGGFWANRLMISTAGFLDASCARRYETDEADCG